MEIDDIASPQDIDRLPILHAALMETLRLWPSVPGGQPRVIPRSCSLGGYHGVPAGTTVQSYASVLHRTPEVFPDPFAWKPERWLDSSPEQLSLMRKWFWGFGSGGRKFSNHDLKSGRRCSPSLPSGLHDNVALVGKIDFAISRKSNGF